MASAASVFALQERTIAYGRHSRRDRSQGHRGPLRTGLRHDRGTSRRARRPHRIDAAQGALASASRCPRTPRRISAGSPATSSVRPSATPPPTPRRLTAGRPTALGRISKRPARTPRRSPASGLTGRCWAPTLVKELRLVDHHPFLYQRHVFTGGRGEGISIANHAMLRLPHGGADEFFAKTLVGDACGFART